MTVEQLNQNMHQLFPDIDAYLNFIPNLTNVIQGICPRLTSSIITGPNKGSNSYIYEMVAIGPKGFGYCKSSKSRRIDYIGFDGFDIVNISDAHIDLIPNPKVKALINEFKTFYNNVILTVESLHNKSLNTNINCETFQFKAASTVALPIFRGVATDIADSETTIIPYAKSSDVISSIVVELYSLGLHFLVINNNRRLIGSMASKSKDHYNSHIPTGYIDMSSYNIRYGIDSPSHAYLPAKKYIKDFDVVISDPKIVEFCGKINDTFSNIDKTLQYLKSKYANLYILNSKSEW